MTVCREHLTFKQKSWATFSPQCCAMQKKRWRICKLLLLLGKCGYCVRTPGSSWESQACHSHRCLRPAQPSSFFTPKLREWPSAGLLVLLIGVSTEHSNRPPSPPPHYAVGETVGRREWDISGACVNYLAEEKPATRNKKQNFEIHNVTWNLEEENNKCLMVRQKHHITSFI